MHRLLLVVLCFVVGVVNAQVIEGELAARQGLSNAAARLFRPGKDTFTVAFLGGSITEAGNGWRHGTAKWLEKQASRPVRSINAAIGGTGSSLGVYRLRKDVLQYRPHLLFVEFAVNDGKESREKILESMEGIVRQTWQSLPQTDICFVYTLSATMAPQYDGKNLPISVKAMEDLAKHYNISSINLGIRVLQQVRSGKLFFAGKQPVSGDSTFFSPDGVHPYPETGYRLYNETVQAALPRLFKKGKDVARVLPKPFFSTALENATLVAASPGNLSGAMQATSFGLDSISGRFSRHFSSVVHLTDTAQRFRGVIHR
jgi:lysophospholipase L1-like esterase